jgi:hypothetical protein
MVGGPLSRSAIKRGWGPRLAVRGSPRRRTHPTPQTLTDPREHWSGGKLRHRRRRGPLPESGAPGATARRSTASYVIPSSLLGKLVFGSIALARPRWQPSVCVRFRSRGKTLRCTGTNETLMPLMPYEFRCAGMIPCGGAYLLRRRC